MKLGAMNHGLGANVRARKLRSEMSISEKVLWEHLRKKRIGYGFKRQVPVGPYILDFYCAQASLCVEIDGEQHTLRQAQDARRDEYLRGVGIETLRIPSLALFAADSAEFVGALRKILETCRARCSHPQPPPSCTNHHEGG